MTIALQRGMTLEEFLAWDEGQEDRWEFDGFQPVAMVGGTRAHASITVNLISALNSRLKGSACTVYNDSLRIIAAGSIRYPDAFVACGPLANDATLAHEPVVVFEVLSPGTASIDQIVKAAEYRNTASIQRYVVLAQDRIAANVHARQGGDWFVTHIVDPSMILDMPEIGISLPLIDLYDGVIDPP